MSCLKVHRLAEFVGKVRWCCYLLIFVDKKASLKPIHSVAFNQCSWQRSGLAWSYYDDNISRAAEFVVDPRHLRRYSGMLARVVFP